MSKEDVSSGRSSDTTSTSAQKKPDSEFDFLSQQANEAGQAIGKAMEDLKACLAEGADVRAWARQYPWITLGSVAVAGFLVAYGVVPSKDEQALKKLEQIERALASAHEEGHQPQAGTAPRRAGGGNTFLSGLASQAMTMLKPAIMAAVTGGMASLQQGQGAGNGASPGAAAAQAAAGGSGGTS